MVAFASHGADPLHVQVGLVYVYIHQAWVRRSWYQDQLRVVGGQSGKASKRLHIAYVDGRLADYGDLLVGAIDAGAVKRRQIVDCGQISRRQEMSVGDFRCEARLELPASRLQAEIVEAAESEHDAAECAGERRLAAGGKMRLAAHGVAPQVGTQGRSPPAARCR